MTSSLRTPAASIQAITHFLGPLGWCMPKITKIAAQFSQLYMVAHMVHISRDPDFVTRDPDFQSRDPDFETLDPELQSRDPEIKKITRVALMGHRVYAKKRVASFLRTRCISVLQNSVSSSTCYKIESIWRFIQQLYDEVLKGTYFD